MTSPIFYWTFLFLCSAYILWKGGPPERVGIAIAIISSILSTASASAEFSVRFSHVEYGVFLVDVATLLAFLLLALAADRFWPLWITGIHLIGVTTHTAKLVSPDVVPWVYASTQALWSYPILLAIVIGTARHRKRLKLYGADSSWRASFGFAGRSKPRNGPTT
jgi:hypothetical protein